MTSNQVALIDISVPITPELPIWPGDPEPRLEPVSSIAAGDEYNVSRLVLSTHSGTHIDAPWHALEHGARLNTVKLSALVGPCQVVDLSHLERHVEARDLEEASIPHGTDRLLLRTRNSLLWGQRDHIFDPTFIALSPSAAEWIVERGILVVGIDYLSIEPFDGDGTVHRLLLRAGVIPLETLDLRAAGAGPYTLLCLPLDLPLADGAPCRAVLTAPERAL
ncbi:MAG TPA: cyclase family protein [Thermomicrobiaceae bacterium]|nr:cyclase family protein [Thermomicrobiaceae bacterium]